MITELSVAFGAGLYISYLAKKELEKRLKEDSREHDEEETPLN